MNMTKAITRGGIAAILALLLAVCLAAPGWAVPASSSSSAQSSSSAAAAKPTPAPAVPSFKVKKKGYGGMSLVITPKGKAAGYQVKYRVKTTDGWQKWVSKSVKKTSVKLKKTEVNHTYKVKVRAYNLDANGKRVYGAFTKAKKVFNGVTPLKSSQITKMWTQSFIHGTKKAGQQRYIMLHDTEGGGTPENVVYGWRNDNGGTVAAHFVVGRDGSVVQTAKLKRILHHAGYGGTGSYDNYDKKFGVGKNNGKGTGDDLRGQVPWAGYTSYGMNSYSIGIEMVHVGGQDYPAAQLKAVDKVIAYIDKAYGGYGGKIIDHKTWRPGNSDCDVNFTTYLKNYQKYRKHTK